MFIHAVPDNRGKKNGYYCSLVESCRVKEDVEGLIKDRYDEAKSEMSGSLTSLKELLAQVPDPKADTDYIEFFCGDDGASDEKTARRDTLYVLTASLTRSFSNCCDKLVSDYGYTEQQVTQLRSDIDGYRGEGIQYRQGGQKRDHDRGVQIPRHRRGLPDGQ